MSHPPTEQWSVEAKSTMGRLKSQWASILGERRSDQRAAAAMQVRRWESTFAAMREQQRLLQKHGRWVGGPFDLLSIVGQARSELVHSAAIAWLIDPGMRHGLGTEVLGRLLDRCFPEESFADLWTVNVSTEVARGQARIDILVEAADWTLIIENKVDAPESPGQCDLYHELFGDEPGVRFVFLSPSGRRAQTATGPAAEAFVSLSYRQVAEDVQSALAATADRSPGPAREVAAQYLQTLERRFL